VGRAPRGRRPPELASRFRQDVLEGLARPHKALPPKYFYDAAGSRLFERICRLREYYPTRVELAITQRYLADIARFAGKGCALLEYGSGESLKSRLLIRALRPSAYIPVDISADALQAADLLEQATAGGVVEILGRQRFLRARESGENIPAEIKGGWLAADEAETA